MRSSRTLCSLLTNIYRAPTGLLGAAHQWKLISRPCTTGILNHHEIASHSNKVARTGGLRVSHASVRRRSVHSSGPWPNTQPHVLNGDGGLHQLKTVEDLKSWFEKRKKEIYCESERHVWCEPSSLCKRGCINCFENLLL